MTISDILYRVLRIPIKLYYQNMLNIKLVSNEMEDYKGPAFIIGNHVAAHDSQISILYTNRLIRMLAAQANWSTAWKRFVFNAFQVIPVIRNATDVKAVRFMVKAVKKGYSVGMYPEAERTWNGDTLEVEPICAKLAKMLKVPVYAVVIKGLYLSRPRWAVKPRKGLIEVEIKKVLDEQQVVNQSVDQVYEAIKNSIGHSDSEWQKQKMIPFSGKDRALGIQRVLYVCDRCHAVNAIQSKGDEFFCTKCLVRRRIDDFGFIIGNCKFRTINEWNEWQKRFIPSIVQNGFVFKMKDVVLDIYSEKKVSQKVNVQFAESSLVLYFSDERRHSEMNITEIESCNLIFKDQAEIFIYGIRHIIKFDIQKNHMSIKLFEDLIKYMIKK